MLERFHFTTLSAWPTIAREGIIPYPLTREHLAEFNAVGVKNTVGIYVWPEVDDSLLQDFLMFKNMKTSVSSGLLLSCEIPEKDLVGSRGYNPQQPFDRLRFWHQLGCTVNGVATQKHRVITDICLTTIPPNRLTAVKKIEIAVSSVTTDLDVLIA